MGDDISSPNFSGIPTNCHVVGIPLRRFFSIEATQLRERVFGLASVSLDSEADHGVACQ